MNAATVMLPDKFVSGQFLQQRLRFLQIFCIKPFGEPAVDLGQHLPGFVLLALFLSQPTQTHHRP
jgi:hypothetical protein